jgi:hypothetical protein
MNRELEWCQFMDTMVAAEDTRTSGTFSKQVVGSMLVVSLHEPKNLSEGLAHAPVLALSETETQLAPGRCHASPRERVRGRPSQVPWRATPTSAALLETETTQRGCVGIRGATVPETVGGALASQDEEESREVVRVDHGVHVRGWVFLHE